MKVILLKLVKNLGKVGDVKEVSEGYAANFLFPQKLAKAATEANFSQLKAKTEKQERLLEKSLHETRSQAEKINKLMVSFLGKVNNAGKLYAAITAPMIFEELKKRGFNIKRDQIVLKDHIKELGQFIVPIILDHSVKANLNLIVKHE
ncbi:MAG: 50S ribosomal protein L9 [bacterium]